MNINNSTKKLHLPNFLIIGAAKAGTSSLYDWLSQHPQIFMSSIKETNFFALEGEKLNFDPASVKEGYMARCITNLELYQAQFQKVGKEIAIGEVSPIYLYHPKASERIQYYLPNVKLIAILRNPVERAYSNFLHHIREDLETLSDFAQALQKVEYRLNNNFYWGFDYIGAGFYYTQLKRYFDKFSPDQIRVYLHEDLQNNSNQLLRDIFQFLGVNETFIPQNLREYNVGGIPKNKIWYNFLSRPSLLKEPFKPFIPTKLRQRIVTHLRNKSLVKPKLSSEVRSHLIDTYRDDILKLQDLIHRDLSLWLRNRASDI